MPIMTAVTVDADALERVVRAAHKKTSTIRERCACGWRPIFVKGKSTNDHGSHVAHQVREALAGRLDWRSHVPGRLRRGPGGLTMVEGGTPQHPQYPAPPGCVYYALIGDGRWIASHPGRPYPADLEATGLRGDVDAELAERFGG